MVSRKVFTFCFSDYLFVYFQKVLDMKLEGYSNYEIYPEEGKIWSYKRNKFVGAKNKNGYWKCNLTNDNGEIWKGGLHRFIWFAVNGEIPEGMQVNHIDENKNNNSIFNLCLMSPKDNINWGSGIERRSKTQSKPVIAMKNGVVKLYFASTQEAQRNGFLQSKICLCCNGEKWVKSHKGYQWKYQDDYLADWWEQEMGKAAI